MTGTQLVVTPRHAVSMPETLTRVAAAAAGLLLVAVLALAWLAWFELVRVALVAPHIG